MDQHQQNQQLSTSVVNPLCIILVKNGSKGDRLLFRYPYKGPPKQPDLDKDKYNSSMNINVSSTPIPSLSSTPLTKKSVFLFPSHNQSSSVFQSPETSEYLGVGSAVKSRKTSRTSPPTRRRNPYSLSKSDDMFISGNNLQEKASKKFSPSGNEMLGELSDKDLSNLLAVSSELSERKFELKLNDVRFVGHPTLMHRPNDVRPLNPLFQTSVKLFHIVFCLNAIASHSIVKCFYDLSKRLGIGLRHEEYRCGYLSQEMKTIIATHDEACAEQTEENEDILEKLYDEIMAKSKLAEIMKKVYDDVCQTGYLFLRVNNWVQISFCLPHRIHYLPFRTSAPLVEPESIHRCLEAIRPYHTILLLIEIEELLATLWIDASSTIPRLLQVYSPLKSLQTMAADADLTLSQVVEIASHLVYWAHATVIYPMCESNVYVVAPDSPLTSSELTDAFTEAFPGVSFSQTMADFSLPMALGERVNPILGGTYVQTELVRLVTWLLKHRILIQLHTYIYLLTYLDGCGCTKMLDNLTVNVDPDISLNLSVNVRSYDQDDEDDVTVSDSFSETTADEAGVSPLPSTHESESGAVVDSEDVDGARQRAQKNNNNEETVEPLEKFKGTLSELNDAVKRAVAMIKSPVSIQDINMFSKLSQYFTGDFHLEEIMYRENVRRSQLMLLLDKFRDVLITVEKEDSDINFFKLNSSEV